MRSSFVTSFRYVIPQNNSLRSTNIMHYKIFSIELLNMQGTKVLIVIELVSRRFDLCQFNLRKKKSPNKNTFIMYFLLLIFSDSKTITERQTSGTRRYFWGLQMLSTRRGLSKVLVSTTPKRMPRGNKDHRSSRNVYRLRNLPRRANNLEGSSQPGSGRCTRGNIQGSNDTTSDRNQNLRKTSASCFLGSREEFTLCASCGHVSTCRYSS